MKFASQFDAKLENLANQLNSSVSSQNKIYDFKKLFDEMFKLDEEWKNYKPEAAGVKIQYNPFEIEKKVNECIKIELIGTEEEKKETNISSLKVFGSESRAIELQLNRAFKSTSDKEKQDESSNESPQLEKKSQHVNCLITKMGTFYIDSGKYVRNLDIDHRFFDYASFQLKEIFFICGGYHYSKGYIREMTCKNQHGKVKYCEKMGYARSSLGLGGANNQLAAVGGKDSKGVLKSYEKYDVIRDKWSFGASMIVSRLQPGVCQMQTNLVYVFCGYQGNALDTVERYTEEKGWQSLNAILNFPAYNLAATPYGKDIILFGGFTQNEEPKRVLSIFKIHENKFYQMSQNAGTPLYMCTRSYFVLGKEIFTGFQIKDKEIIYYFNGDYWKSISHS